MQGYFIISRPCEKHWCLRIFAALSFPFPRFNLNTLNLYRSFAGHVTNISAMNMSHIVKATELKLIKQSVSNATWPNYANYEVTHALTCLSYFRASPSVPKTYFVFIV